MLPVQPRSRHLALLAAALAVLFAGLGPAVHPTFSATHERPVVVVELDGAVDDVSARFLSRAIDEANADLARLIVIRLDTPGGLLGSTRDIVGDIFASRVPVAVYVAPEGAQAASAGTFIAASAGVLAMAPTTNIGAAAVVGAGGQDLPETLGKKVSEDARAFMRSIAERRGRPAGPLEAAVREARAYSAQEAVKLGIADLVAPTLGELLARLDGRSVAAAGGEVRVRTARAPVQMEEMSFLERVLGFLADPNVVFLLLGIGQLAILIEILNPGLWVPGTVGVVCLILGFAGLGNLPFTWAGVALFAVAAVLFLFEAHAPGFGLFGAAGAVALVLSGLFLLGFYTPELSGPSFRISRWLLVGLGATVGLVVLWLASEVRRSHGSVYVSPLSSSGLIGQAGEVTARLVPQGEVLVSGERWSAELVDGDAAEIGEAVEVTGKKEMMLLVQRAPDGGAAVPPPGGIDEID